jgi:hypothetical protein
MQILCCESINKYKIEYKKNLYIKIYHFINLNI